MGEVYKGIKFKVLFNKKVAIKNEKLFELINWFKTFRKENLAPVENGQAGGNLSFRENNKTSFIITGTQIGLDTTIDNSKLVRVLSCDLENKTTLVEGLREPSSETFLHSEIYQKRPDINAIFHGHSPEILANYKKLNIKCTKKEAPYGSLELVNSVLEILDGATNFLIIKNHGFLSFGKTMQEAGKKSQATLKDALTLF